MSGYSADEFQNQIGEVYPRLHRAMTAYLYGSDIEADDILQETFLKAIRNLDKFDGKSNLYTWLYTIARNACIDHFRKTKNEKKRSDFPVEDYPIAAEIQSDDEEITLLRMAITQLPQDLRELVIMKSIDEMSYPEISEITGVNEQTLKSRMMKARRLLAENLRKLGVHQP